MVEARLPVTEVDDNLLSSSSSDYIPGIEIPPNNKLYPRDEYLQVVQILWHILNCQKEY